MRSSFCIFLAWTAACLAGCTPAPSEAPPLAQVAPIAKSTDWADVADRPAAPAPTAAMSAVADAPAKAKATAKPKPALRAAVSKAAAKAPVRHALFARLPKDALFVIEVADLRNLPATFKSSELGRMYAQPAVAEKMQPMLAELRQGLERVRADSPEVAAALALLPWISGPAALSISGLSAETLGASTSTWPWVLTVVHDAGDQADRLAEVLAPLLAAQAQKLGLELSEKAEPAWGCEIGNEQVLIDFERHGNVFELRAGGRGSVLRELIAARKRNDTNSFFGAVVGRTASDVAALGAEPLFEAHLQFTPLWDSLRTLANRQDMRMLDRTGLDKVHGMSLEVGRTARGLAESLTLHSPAALDLFSHALTGSPLDTKMARCVPAELPNAGLYSFDGRRLLEDLFLLIPGPAQGELVRSMAEFKRETGVDVDHDLLTVFGPTFAVATSAAPGALFAEEMPRIFLACKLRDPSRAQRSLDALLLAAGRSAEVQQQWMDDVRVHTLDLSKLQPGANAVSWCVDDDVLFVSTHLELLHAGVSGWRGSEVVHAGLKSALAKPEPRLFAVGFTRGDAATPDSIVLGRATGAGLELCAADGAAMQSSIAALFVAGIASGVAIPHLMKARMEANEKAAVARLAVIGSAQALAFEARYLDQDRDGLGEYLFLDELTGAAALRGGLPQLSDPWLKSDFRWEAPGIGVKNGYRYRVDLRLENGARAWTASAAGSTPVDSDDAELGFVVFAWPDRNDSGRGAFVLDPEIGLYSSDNLAPQQSYAGTHAPLGAAHLAAEGFSNDAVRRVGRDGGIWLRLRGL